MRILPCKVLKVLILSIRYNVRIGVIRGGPKNKLKIIAFTP